MFILSSAAGGLGELSAAPAQGLVQAESQERGYSSDVLAAEQ